MSFFNKNKDTINNKMFIGRGFSLDDKKREKLVDIYLEDDNCFNHSFVFGSTGVGKTRLIEGLIEQDIPKQNNIVIIDPKGDIGLFSKVTEIAKKHNREKDLLFLSPIYPDYSIKINPLKNYSMEEEIISHIVASVPAKDEFFYNIALETTTVIVKSLLIIRRYNKDESALNFDEVSSKASYNGLKDLRETLENIKDDTEEERELEKF